MNPYIHKVDKNVHSKFLSEGRKDPYTKAPIKHGDQIVFCAGACKCAFLYDSWKSMGGKHCNQTETLKDFVITTKIKFGRLKEPPTSKKRNRSTISDIITNIIGIIFWIFIIKLVMSSFFKPIRNLQQTNNKSQIQSQKSTYQSIPKTNKTSEIEEYTYVNFCNKTSYQTIYTALTYWDGTGFFSRGWYPVKSGECQKVMVAQNYNGNVYVYGNSNRGEREWGSGQYSFCVDIVDRFSISESDKVSCSGTNQKKVTMSEFSVSPGTNKFSLK